MQQEDRYQKKFAFERGQYHQCIPNPQKENQMITVELIARVFNDLADIKKGKDEHEDFFSDDQREWPGDPGLDKEPDQSHFQRYHLVPPKDEYDEDSGEGDGEEKQDEEEDEPEDKGG